MDTTTYTKTIDICWTLAEQGLDMMTVASIAGQSGISETDLNALFPDQKFILLALLADIKAKVALAEYSETLLKDDQFFDAVMSYYDACQPHKSAIKKLSEGLLWSPLLSLAIAPSMQQLSNELTDKYYPLSENSIKATCQNAGLKLAIQILLLRVFYKWLEDESFDLGATMASLDQGMKQINKLKEYF